MDIVLHSSSGSNSSERVEWVLRYKGIPYTKIDSLDLGLSPYGYVPSLFVDGTVLAESMAIAEYLEETFPQEPLFPKNAFDRALVREVCEYVNSTIHQPQSRSVMSFFDLGLEAAAEKKLRGEWIVCCLRKLRTRLWRQSAFAVGEDFTIADIFVASIYRKALSHGVEALPEYDRYMEKLSEVTGFDVHG